jgi:hypothetical protein
LTLVITPSCREGQDGVIRVVEEAAIPLLALPNGFLGASALRDVAKDAELLDGPPLGVPDEVGPSLGWHQDAVSAHRLEFEDFGELLPGQRPADALLPEFDRGRGDNPCDVVAN